MVKNLLQVQLKANLIKLIKKTEEETGCLIGNKITNRMRKVSRSSPQNNTETIT